MPIKLLKRFQIISIKFLILFCCLHLRWTFFCNWEKKKAIWKFKVKFWWSSCLTVWFICQTLLTKCWMLQLPSLQRHMPFWLKKSSGFEASFSMTVFILFLLFRFLQLLAAVQPDPISLKDSWLMDLFGRHDMIHLHELFWTVGWRSASWMFFFLMSYFMDLSWGNLRQGGK